MKFEEWLEKKFGENYGDTKDQYEDDLDHWMSELDVQELIDYAQEWGDERVTVKH